MKNDLIRYNFYSLFASKREKEVEIEITDQIPIN